MRLCRRCRIWLLGVVPIYATLFVLPHIHRYAQGDETGVLLSFIAYGAFASFCFLLFPVIWQRCDRRYFVTVKSGELWLEGTRRVVLAKVARASLWCGDNVGESILVLELDSGDCFRIPETENMKQLLCEVRRSINVRVVQMDRRLNLWRVGYSLFFGALLLIMAGALLAQYSPAEF